MNLFTSEIILAEKKLLYGFRHLSSLSYVDKVRSLQKMKESDELCSSLVTKGRFMAFAQSQPLIVLKENSRKEMVNLSHPSLIAFKDLSKHVDIENKKKVLASISDDGCPLFGIQLGKREEHISLAETFNSTFADLRQSFIRLGWKDASLVSKVNALLMFHKRNAFCGLCGTRTKSNVSGASRQCPSCGESFYPATNPVGIVFISDQKGENCLLVRPSRIPRGFYTCVAGFSDPGESLEQTCKREIAEEVGLEATNITYVGSQHWPFPGSLMCGCYATVEDTAFQLDEAELEDGKWFTREEVTDAINAMRGRSVGNKPVLMVPPPGTLSHQLIRNWVDRTPPQDMPPKISFGIV